MTVSVNHPPEQKIAGEHDREPDDKPRASMTDCGGDDEQDGSYYQGEREDGLGRAVGDATLRTAVGAAAVDPKHAAAEDAERNDDAGGREQVRSSSSSPPTFGWRWTVSLLVHCETGSSRSRSAVGSRVAQCLP